MQAALKDYKVEKTIGYCMEAKESGSTPLYRFRNSILNGIIWKWFFSKYLDQFYTSDENEKNAMQANENYQFQGIQCYVLTSNSCSKLIKVKTHTKTISKQKESAVVSSSAKNLPIILFIVANWILQ